MQLASLPTRLETLQRLPDAYGLDRPLYIKRDDLTGLSVSGNKIRKLEYLVADALQNGCDTLVTHGGHQSNHCRATAAVAARLGLRCRMFLRWLGDDEPARRGNLLLDELFGATLSFHDQDRYAQGRAKLIEEVMQEQRDQGRKPYFFPVGGSVPIGSWGYIRAMAELRDRLGPSRPVEVYCAVGSCGTHAGCVLGKALLGLDRWRVVGIPIAGTADGMAQETRMLVQETAEQFGLAWTEASSPIEVLGGFIGEGYAIPTPEGVQAIRDAARLEGLVLDPSYTGKAMAGVLHAMKTGFASRDADVVFIHTGGAFGLMGAAEAMA